MPEDLHTIHFVDFGEDNQNMNQAAAGTVDLLLRTGVFVGLCLIVRAVFRKFRGTK